MNGPTSTNFHSIDPTSMCAQTIFRVLDFLTAWVVEKSSPPVVKKGNSKPSSGAFPDFECIVVKLYCVSLLPSYLYFVAQLQKKGL